MHTSARATVNTTPDPVLPIRWDRRICTDRRSRQPAIILIDRRVHSRRQTSLSAFLWQQQHR